MGQACYPGLSATCPIACRAHKREELLSQRRNPGAPLAVCVLPLCSDVDMPRFWAELVAASQPVEAQAPTTPTGSSLQSMEVEEQQLAPAGKL